jgi:hypothetical protein
MKRSIKTTVTVTALVVIAGALWMAMRSAEHVLIDIDGVTHGTLEHPDQGSWSVLMYMTADCPIANQYAPEIQRICDSYESKGVRCYLVYADPSLSKDVVRKHAQDFHGARYPAILDSDYRLVDAAGATVSSETAVFSRGGKLEYRGRIDDFNAALGVQRQQATQHDLLDALDALIAGRSVANTRTEAIGCFLPTRSSGASS